VRSTIAACQELRTIKTERQLPSLGAQVQRGGDCVALEFVNGHRIKSARNGHDRARDEVMNFY
jgi:hypothetical protein